MFYIIGLKFDIKFFIDLYIYLGRIKFTFNLYKEFRRNRLQITKYTKQFKTRNKKFFFNK